MDEGRIDITYQDARGTLGRFLCVTSPSTLPLYERLRDHDWETGGSCFFPPDEQRNTAVLVWGDSERQLSFMLVAPLPQKELENIAESVTTNDFAFGAGARGRAKIAGKEIG